MIIARSLNEVEYNAASVITVGSFDGVHLGHRAILSDVVTRANGIKGRSVVVTFDPHPKEVVGDGKVDLLTTLDERVVEIGKFQVDLLLLLKFTYEFSRQSPREFYQRFIIQGVGASEIVEGHDHTFGKDREAGMAALVDLGREFGINTTAVHPVTVQGETVGSTAIRASLAEGNVEKAGRFLGRPFALSGNVVHGDQRGAALGFPTANIERPDTRKIVPANGVYAVTAEWKGIEHPGMLNIGHRPTFGNDLARTIEVHFFDVREPMYGESLTIKFHKKIRDEKAFSSKEELITQLQSDRIVCKELLASMRESNTPYL